MKTAGAQQATRSSAVFARGRFRGWHPLAGGFQLLPASFHHHFGQLAFAEPTLTSPLVDESDTAERRKNQEMLALVSVPDLLQSFSLQRTEPNSCITGAGRFQSFYFCHAAIRMPFSSPHFLLWVDMFPMEFSGTVRHCFSQLFQLSEHTVGSRHTVRRVQWRTYPSVMSVSPGVALYCPASSPSRDRFHDHANCAGL